MELLDPLLRMPLISSVRILSVALCCLYAGLAHAQTPQYRHVMIITNQLYSISAGAEPQPGDSDFGGHSSADLQVSRRANAAGLIHGWNGSDRVFKALISTDHGKARDRLQTQWPIYNTNGDLLATNSDDSWDGSLISP